MRIFIGAILIALTGPFFATQAQSLCVNVSKANLRYGPSTNHQKTWEVYRYMPFERLAARSGWFRVKDVDGDIHWIASQLVTTQFKCAVVRVPRANLRQGPGTNHPEVRWSPAEKYYAFKVLRQQGSWVHVEDAAGGKAWVAANLVWIP